jgi:hypothetical protein
MNMPRFTAEASLYQTSGHHQTGRNRCAIHLAARMAETITPADIPSEVPIDVPGEETIVLHGEAPPCPFGWKNVGGTCVLEGSGGGPGTVGEPGGEGGGPGGGVGGGPMTTPKLPKPPRKSPKTGTPFKPKADAECHAIRFFEGGNFNTVINRGSYVPLSNGIWVCDNHDPGHEPGSDVRCGSRWAKDGKNYIDSCYNGTSY